MNDTQIWTALIGMLSGMLAFMTLVPYVFDRSLDHRFKAVFELMNARFDQVDSRFTEIDRRFDRLETRFDRLEARVDGLDRDVTALTRRGLGDQ